MKRKKLLIVEKKRPIFLAALKRKRWSLDVGGLKGEEVPTSEKWQNSI